MCRLYIIIKSVDETNGTRHGILAQLGEHLPYKQRVIGSSPIGPMLQKNMARWLNWLERPVHTREVESSSLSLATKRTSSMSFFIWLNTYIKSEKGIIAL